MTSSPVLHLPSVEQFPCTVTTEVDPTGGAVAFGLTLTALASDVSVWANGSWLGSPSLSGGVYRSRALTPLIGPGQTLAPTVATWHAWCRIGGSGGVIKPAGILIVR